MKSNTENRQEPARVVQRILALYAILFFLWLGLLLCLLLVSSCGLLLAHSWPWAKETLNIATKYITAIQDYWIAVIILIFPLFYFPMVNLIAKIKKANLFGIIIETKSETPRKESLITKAQICPRQ